MSELKNVPEAIALAQLEKLQLEIAQLNKSRWTDRIGPFTNLLSIVIAVSGFLFGIYQFQKQQQALNQQLIFEQEKYRVALDREHQTKLQDQIRSDVEQLLQFSRDKELTISKVVFLLSDLETCISNKFSGLQEDTNSPTKNMVREVSALLGTAVSNEGNFDEPRDVKFLNTLLNNWDDYEEYLKGDKDEIEYLLDKYAESIERIYHMDPSVVRTATYDANTAIFSYDEGQGKLDYRTRDHFQDLVVGFSRAYGLLADKEASEWLAVKFQASTCNPTLTKQLLEISFATKGRSELVRCLE
ncbi:MAG TPA: hypothetical protein VFY34_01075 [Pyrinomonadaceae bacterium]|nr:hypothetical protein [Pyrinomonadaceae bacterium]